MYIHVPLHLLLYYVRLITSFDIHISKNCDIMGPPLNVMTQASQ